METAHPNHQPQDTAVYMQLRALLKPALHRLYPQDIQGAHNIPTSGGAILASNHVSFIDSIFLPLASPRQIYFLAKSDYFTTGGLKGKIMRWFFTSVGQLPMDRSGGHKSAQSLAAAVTALKDGKLVGIYPEGTRSPDGRLYRAKIGVARLALQTGVPVIPVAQIGNEDIQVPGSNRLRTRKNGQRIRITTIIGQPIDTTPYLDRANDWATQRELADRIQEAISALSGRPIVPVYASSVKELMAQENISATQASDRILATQKINPHNTKDQNPPQK